MGAIINITEFDDGCSACNITQNTTKYITLPLNASMLEANVSLRGIKTVVAFNDIVTNFAFGTRYLSVTIGDLNNDTHPDLMMGEANDPYARGWLNDGNNNFILNSSWDSQSPCSAFRAMPSLIDIDNDGDLDLAISGCVKTGITLKEPLFFYEVIIIATNKTY